jgi:hypothetical protein
MTTTYNDSQTRTPAPAWPLFATLGIGLAAISTALGTFFDITGNDSSSGNGNAMGEYLVTLGIIVVITAIVFGLVVRTASARNAGTRSLVLGILAVPSLVLFWAGLPCVLAAGAAACALASRTDAGQFTTRGKVAMVLAGVVSIGAMVMGVVG